MSKPFTAPGRSGHYGLVLVMLVAVWTVACSVPDSVSPGRDAAAQVNPGSSNDAVGQRPEGTFSGGPKRGKLQRGGRLAFSTFTGEIYTMEPDGFGLASLGAGQDPGWSPDGRQIAFSRASARPSSPYWHTDVYVMDADGSNVRLVARDAYQPTWSPDGTRLAFGCGGICSINLDGTDRKVLTTHEFQPATPDQCIRDSDPTWSPNGTTIAFTRWPDARIPVSMCLSLGLAVSFPFDFWTEVWFVEADGSRQRPLRGADGAPLTYAGWPAWSPDGSKLAVYALTGGFESIKVANADGSGLRDVVHRIPDFFEFLGGADWSPDGNQIVVGSGFHWGFVDVAGPATSLQFTPQRQAISSVGTWSWSRR